MFYQGLLAMLPDQQYALAMSIDPFLCPTWKNSPAIAILTAPAQTPS